MGLKNWLIKKALEGKFPLWMYRLLGKRLAKVLDLKEGGSMAESIGTQSKESIPWYKSKTVWSAIIAAVLGLVQPISTAFGHPYQVPLWVFEFLAGLGLYSLRTANTSIDNSKN